MLLTLLMMWLMLFLSISCIHNDYTCYQCSADDIYLYWKIFSIK